MCNETLFMVEGFPPQTMDDKSEDHHLTYWAKRAPYITEEVNTLHLYNQGSGNTEMRSLYSLCSILKTNFWEFLFGDFN